MIKVEKHGDIATLEVRGDSYTLVDEYDAVLRSLYQFLKEGVKDPELVTPEALMYKMMEKAIREERAES